MTVGQLVKAMFGGLILPSINILNILAIIFGILAIIGAYFLIRYDVKGFPVTAIILLLSGLISMFLGCWTFPIDVALGLVGISFVIFVFCTMQTIRKED